MAKEKTGSSSNGMDRTEPSHYGLLGLHPAASVSQIRQSYRELSKLYHPDTTELPTAIATQKFQQLNEAYATLSNPERRAAYDLSIGYSRVVVVRPLPSLHQPQKSEQSSSAYLDATDRPLSGGELFALFILGVTFLACLILAITIGVTRGDQAFQPLTAQHSEQQSDSTQRSPYLSPNLNSEPAIIEPAVIEPDFVSSDSYDPTSQ